MAITRNAVQVQWSASNSKSVAAGATEVSDAVSMDATTAQASATLKADNNGTPASGDVVVFYWAPTTGDPDGASTAEYPTDVKHMEWLAEIDTNTQDPDVVTVPLPANPYRGKIVAESKASSNGITVSATIEETRVS